MDPVGCVSGIAMVVGISMPTQQRAIRIIIETERRGIVAGEALMGFEAASLYYSCVLEGEKKTQKQIAYVANVTEVTIRNITRGLEKRLLSHARIQPHLRRSTLH